MSDAILLDIKDQIALITLNRPQRLNALNYDLIDRLMSALDLVEVEAGVRAIVLTGAGERAFSAGATFTNSPATCTVERIPPCAISSGADRP